LRINGDHGVKPPAEDFEQVRPRTRPGSEPDSGDRIEISDRAKDLRGGGPAPARGEHPEPVAGEAAGIRAEIAGRMESGFYDRQTTIERIAGRILDLLGFKEAGGR
jgi:hypothetical protein